MVRSNRMKNFLWVIQATLRAARWRSTAVEPSGLGFHRPHLRRHWRWLRKPRASILTVDGPAAFSIYGINSIIAAMAVFVAIASLFISKDRAVVLAQLAALATLLEWMLIAASRLPFPVYNPMPGIGLNRQGSPCHYHRAGLVDRRRCRRIPRRRHRALSEPVLRAFWLYAVAGAAIVALPAFPTFLGREYDQSSYNIWEWSYAKFSKFRPTM